MSQSDERGLSTRCVYAGELSDAHSSPHTLVYKTITHHGLAPEEWTRRCITDTMIRLSVSLEDPEELIEDLEQTHR